jgi:hypothetical protein
MKNLQNEFDYIMDDVLDFGSTGFNLFRKFYIESELYGEIVINNKLPKEGIKKIVMLPPETMFIEFDNFERIKSFRQKMQLNDPRLKLKAGTVDGIIDFKNNEIAYVNSGIITRTGNNERLVLGFLDRARVAYRQLKWMEDALLIYRLVRAPERRVFRIGVGNLPTPKVNEYMKSIIARFKQKKIYNSQTGEIDIGRNIQCLSLDTKISLLDGRELSLSEIITEFESGAKLETYSIDETNGKVVPGEIKWAGITRKDAEVVKVILDNGSEEIVTPDHKFLLHVLSVKEAKDLKSGDQLMVINSDPVTVKYVLIFADKVGRIDTGCITVETKENPDHCHNFRLSSGVVVRNSMTEDIFLPDRGDGSGPKVETMPGGASLGEINDILYFVKKLFKALKIPVKRLDENNIYDYKGETTSREEIKFAKYVARVRNIFIDWLVQIYETHLRLKGLYDQYELVKGDISINLNQENEWRETKKLNNLHQRVATFNDLSAMQQKVFSDQWLKKNILKLTDEEIAENNEQMKQEKEEKAKEEAANIPKDNKEITDSNDNGVDDNVEKDARKEAEKAFKPQTMDQKVSKMSKDKKSLTMPEVK